MAMDTTQTLIMDRVRRGFVGGRQDPGGVFTPKDFLDLASRAAVDQGVFTHVHVARPVGMETWLGLVVHLEERREKKK